MKKEKKYTIKDMKKEIIELKRKLEENGIDTTNLVYMPVIPVLGIEKQYVIEEWFGIKVAKLISPPND